MMKRNDIPIRNIIFQLNTMFRSPLLSPTMNRRSEKDKYGVGSGEIIIKFNPLILGEYKSAMWDWSWDYGEHYRGDNFFLTRHIIIFYLI